MSTIFREKSDGWVSTISSFIPLHSAILMFPIARQGNPLGMLRICNVGVMMGVLDEMCENERAAIILAKSGDKK